MFFSCKLGCIRSQEFLSSFNQTDKSTNACIYTVYMTLKYELNIDLQIPPPLIQYCWEIRHLGVLLVYMPTSSKIVLDMERELLHMVYAYLLQSEDSGGSCGGSDSSPLEELLILINTLKCIHILKLYTYYYLQSVTKCSHYLVSSFSSSLLSDDTCPSAWILYDLQIQRNNSLVLSPIYINFSVFYILSLETVRFDLSTENSALALNIYCSIDFVNLVRV